MLLFVDVHLTACVLVVHPNWAAIRANNCYSENTRLRTDLPPPHIKLSEASGKAVIGLWEALNSLEKSAEDH